MVHDQSWTTDLLRASHRSTSQGLPALLRMSVYHLFSSDCYRNSVLMLDGNKIAHVKHLYTFT